MPGRSRSVVSTRKKVCGVGGERMLTTRREFVPEARLVKNCTFLSQQRRREEFATTCGHAPAA